MGGVFVTGTDTGVGKTLVACGIAGALRLRGLRVGVMKPFETGCARDSDGRLVPADAEMLRAHAGAAHELDSICPYRFEEPLAPKVAAGREGTSIDLDRVERAYEKIAGQSDVTIVEGAGGLLVPVAERITMADVAARLRLPLLVVVGSKLGALNHAVLTIECARARGLGLAGYIVNFVSPGDDTAASTNVGELREWLGAPLGVIAHVAGGVGADPARRREIAALFAARLDVDRLLIAAVAATGAPIPKAP